MLHPFSPYLVSVLYLYNFFYPISPQKAKLDMLTLDRHQSEQASIIFINTLHTRIEPPTVRFTNYPSSGSKLGFPQVLNSTCSLADKPKLLFHSRLTQFVKPPHHLHPSASVLPSQTSSSTTATKYRVAWQDFHADSTHPDQHGYPPSGQRLCQ
jgi:hypothetical protein